jgi:hypothetical protein
MSCPSIKNLKLLHETFYGNRSRIKELGVVVTCEGVPKKGCDPYDLTEFCVDEQGNDVLRTLEMPAGIKLFPFLRTSTKILLRREYVYIYKNLKSCFDKRFEKCNGAVVTGHPGIGGICCSFVFGALFDSLLYCKGKTVFLFYVLFQCILDGQPTLLRHEFGKIIGFADEFKVFPSPPLTEEHRYGTWALADSEFSADEEGTPGNELKGNNLFTIFTVSPLEARYREFCKQRNASTLVMNPYTLDEFLFSAWAQIPLKGPLPISVKLTHAPSVAKPSRKQRFLMSDSALYSRATVLPLETTFAWQLECVVCNIITSFEMS